MGNASVQARGVQIEASHQGEGSMGPEQVLLVHSSMKGSTSCADHAHNASCSTNGRNPLAC